MLNLDRLSCRATSGHYIREIDLRPYRTLRVVAAVLATVRFVIGLTRVAPNVEQPVDLVTERWLRGPPAPESAEMECTQKVPEAES